MGARRDINKILIIGSGPIMIGQACEFDYSGNQAVRALKEEGYTVILVNPNPATIMTTPGTADAIYMDPLEVPYLEAIIRAERPDAVLPTMGGQTALNLTMDLETAGVFERYGVEVIGARTASIRMAEDRGEFKLAMDRIGLESAKSAFVHNLEEARAFLERSCVPVIIRPSYTLGGRGGAIAYTREDFEQLLDWALAESPTHTALLEESLLGWKEFELEVVRDAADNAVIVCSIENIDPMGVHTGDSITVAPIQTLSDATYQRMRTAAIEVLREIGVDCGGSNVQFAVHPETERMVVIEMNPRVSRSSALASKATGFPIARCAAKLAAGFTLDEVVNDITGKTVSCFEPALDYCAVKVPRFELEKFPLGYEELGTQMKSVGESLAIGRSFTEAFNKAIRACEFGFDGIEELPELEAKTLDRMIDSLHPRRLFAVYTVLKRRGAEALEDLAKRTAYDRWFLYHLLELAELERRLSREELTEELLLEAKASGLTDRRIATLRGEEERSVRAVREGFGLFAGYHFVDTCAGEFDADTPYFYGTYGEVDEGEPLRSGGVVILASGPNRIGQGLEFDTCCTLSSMAYRRLGVKSVIINSNPETVSTDFNVSDRLYLEPLTAEDVAEVLRKEGLSDVVVQLGGQTPLNMAEQLEAYGARVVGTPVESIQGVEDRGLFAALITRLGLRQPANRMAGTPEEVERCAAEIGYPVLLRPSYVLGGRSMMIAYTREELLEFLAKGIVITPERPVLVDQFLEDAFEYDVDAVADGEFVYVGGVMQHIEAAGIHSGDSACVFPAYKSSPETERQIVEATALIARDIGVRGLLNIQFAVKDNELYVIEVNPRASRTVPFISKVSGVDLVEAAVRVWQGENLQQQGLIPAADAAAAARAPADVVPAGAAPADAPPAGRPPGNGSAADGPPLAGVGVGRCITGWAVKEAMFSFDRFRGLDPLLGPEMRSTGEAIGIGADFGEAFAKASAAVGTQLPTAGRVFVSVHDADKPALLAIVRELEALGFTIAATRGTAQYLYDNGVFAEVILKVHEGRPNILNHLEAGRIAMVVNTPLGRFTQRDDDYIRIEALRNKVPCTTTISAATAAVAGIRYLKQGLIEARRLPEPAAR